MPLAITLPSVRSDSVAALVASLNEETVDADRRALVELAVTVPADEIGASRS